MKWPRRSQVPAQTARPRAPSRTTELPRWPSRAARTAPTTRAWRAIRHTFVQSVTSRAQAATLSTHSRRSNRWPTTCTARNTSSDSGPGSSTRPGPGLAPRHRARSRGRRTHAGRCAAWSPQWRSTRRPSRSNVAAPDRNHSAPFPHSKVQPARRRVSLASRARSRGTSTSTSPLRYAAGVPYRRAWSGGPLRRRTGIWASNSSRTRSWVPASAQRARATEQRPGTNAGPRRANCSKVPGRPRFAILLPRPPSRVEGYIRLGPGARCGSSS